MSIMVAKLPRLKSFPETIFLFLSALLVVLSLYVLNRNVVIRTNFTRDRVKGATTSAAVSPGVTTRTTNITQTKTTIVSTPSIYGPIITSKTTTTTFKLAPVSTVPVSSAKATVPTSSSVSTKTVVTDTPITSAASPTPPTLKPSVLPTTTTTTTTTATTTTVPTGADSNAPTDEVAPVINDSTNDLNPPAGSSADSNDTDSTIDSDSRGTVEINSDQGNLVLTDNAKKQSAKEIKVTIRKRGTNSEVNLRSRGSNLIIEGSQSAATYKSPVFLDQFKGQFLSADTRGRRKPLAILPDQVKSKLLTNRIEDEVISMALLDNTDKKSVDDEVFTVHGYKQIKIGEIFSVKTMVEAKVGARTGKVLSLKEPLWLKILSPFSVYLNK